MTVGCENATTSTPSFVVKVRVLSKMSRSSSWLASLGAARTRAVTGVKPPLVMGVSRWMSSKSAGVARSSARRSLKVVALKASPPAMMKCRSISGCNTAPGGIGGGGGGSGTFDGGNVDPGKRACAHGSRRSSTRRSSAARRICRAAVCSRHT